MSRSRSRGLVWLTMVLVLLPVGPALAANADAADLARATAKLSLALRETDRLMSAVRAPISLTQARAQLAAALRGLSTNGTQTTSPEPSRIEVDTAAAELQRARESLDAAEAVGLPPLPDAPVDVGDPVCTVPRDPCAVQPDHPAALGAPLPYMMEFISGYWTWGGNTYVAECGIENGADDPNQTPMNEADPASHVTFYGSVLCNRQYAVNLTTELHIWGSGLYNGGVIASPATCQYITTSCTAVGNYDRTHGESEWIHSRFTVDLSNFMAGAKWQDLPYGCSGNGTAVASCSLISIPFSYVPYPPDPTPLLNAVLALVNQALGELQSETRAAFQSAMALDDGQEDAALAALDNLPTDAPGSDDQAISSSSSGGSSGPDGTMVASVTVESADLHPGDPGYQPDPNPTAHAARCVADGPCSSYYNCRRVAHVAIIYNAQSYPEAAAGPVETWCYYPTDPLNTPGYIAYHHLDKCLVHVYNQLNWSKVGETQHSDHIVNSRGHARCTQLFEATTGADEGVAPERDVWKLWDQVNYSGSGSWRVGDQGLQQVKTPGLG